MLSNQLHFLPKVEFLSIFIWFSSFHCFTKGWASWHSNVKMNECPIYPTSTQILVVLVLCDMYHSHWYKMIFCCFDFNFPNRQFFILSVCNVFLPCFTFFKVIIVLYVSWLYVLKKWRPKILSQTAVCLYGKEES